ncbi:hypothetical protein CEXT_117661 [Caerostris extrusa]|uniref:Uncharacterized protein n=1 Tax=Caerostris extrusa TaxID=172846 RepID=A0AAV4QYC5_CAEEX|nr:hypothetical protein CEXT_117661 [Caerostris extrusa]
MKSLLPSGYSYATLLEISPSSDLKRIADAIGSQVVCEWVPNVPHLAVPCSCSYGTPERGGIRASQCD